MFVQVSAAPKHRSTHIPNYQVPNVNHMNVMKTSLTIIPMCPRECLSHIRTCTGLSFATKRIGPPCCTLFTFIACYPLQIIYHKTICYLQFQCLQKIPYRKPLVISLCSSLGSTLLLIKRTMIYPLYLWVISY